MSQRRRARSKKCRQTLRKPSATVREEEENILTFEMEILDGEGSDVECSSSIRDTQQTEQRWEKRSRDEVELAKLIDVRSFDARGLHGVCQNGAGNV